MCFNRSKAFFGVITDAPSRELQRNALSDGLPANQKTLSHTRAIENLSKCTKSPLCISAVRCNLQKRSRVSVHPATMSGSSFPLRCTCGRFRTFDSDSKSLRNRRQITRRAKDLIAAEPVGYFRTSHSVVSQPCFLP